VRAVLDDRDRVLTAALRDSPIVCPLVLGNKKCQRASNLPSVAIPRPPR
jgi:hypothetical protein